MKVLNPGSFDQDLACLAMPIASHQHLGTMAFSKAPAAAAAAGTCTDPIILSSDDEDAVEVVAEKSKGEQPRSSKKRRIEKEENPASTSASPSGSASSGIKSNTFTFGGKREFCLIVIVEPDEECRAFLKRCEQTCDPAIHQHCFQRDGTYHFTLETYKGDKGSLTYQEAMAISFRKPAKNLFDKSKADLPTFNLTGYKGYSGAVALGTDTSISGIVNGFSGLRKSLDASKVQGNLHMSLYRTRVNKEAGETWDDPVVRNRKTEFKRIMNTLKDGFGKAKAVRIVLKEMKAEYDGRDGKFFRVWE